MQKILIVEDETTISNNVMAYLKKENYEVIQAFDGKEALELFEKHSPNMIILDLMIPKISGEEVCKKIRETSQTPIIMLSAKAMEDNKIQGLNIGADDYVTKPFSPKELVARVNSLFRRTKSIENKPFVAFNNGELKINYEKYLVLKNDIPCPLTKSEMNLLFTLSKSSHKVFTREELIAIILGADFDGYDRAIDSHIKNLRSKIEKDSSKPEYIVTVRGVGYRFGGVKN